VPLYTLPELPYALTALEPAYSSELLELHHDVHHAGYVKALNAALADLEEARGGGDHAHVARLQRDVAFNLSGHVLHSLFWRNLTPGGSAAPAGALSRHLGRDLGGFDGLREQMSAAATSLQGAGWAVLAWEPVGGRLVVEQIHDHENRHGTGTTPLLALDLWEHAYYLQYRNDKAEWVKRFWEIVDWEDVAHRLERAQGQEADGARSREVASPGTRARHRS
jgi:Fe-Mn family superoxide dismutase